MVLLLVGRACGSPKSGVTVTEQALDLTRFNSGRRSCNKPNLSTSVALKVRFF
jgi:hypothetical protein